MIEIIPTDEHRMEYITIIGIMVTMTVWDFVIGVLFGIIVSCKCRISLSSFKVSQFPKVFSLSFKIPRD